MYFILHRITFPRLVSSLHNLYTYHCLSGLPAVVSQFVLGAQIGELLDPVWCRHGCVILYPIARALYVNKESQMFVHGARFGPSRLPHGDIAKDLRRDVPETRVTKTIG